MRLKILIMNKFIKLEYLLLSVVFIFGFLVRLYKINNPIADWHSWRQADTASVTRTYIERGINLLYPKYQDISSIQTGIYNPRGYRFVEFPIYNALNALISEKFTLFSFEVWGRLLSISFSMLSALILFLLGKKYMGFWGGLLSSFFFLFIPFNIYFSRVILPEPMAVFFGLLGLWLFVGYIDSESRISLILSGLAFTLSLLLKPFTIFYLFPCAYLTVKKYGRDAIFKKAGVLIPLLVFLDLVFIPFLVWRIWINQYPAGIPHFEWAFNGDKIRFRLSFWQWMFGERLGRLILGGWGLIPFGFGVAKRPKTGWFNQFFGLGMFFYIVIVATASVRHDYYQILIIPAVALLLAQGVTAMWQVKEFNKVIARGLVIFSIFMMIIMGVSQVKEFYKINHPEIIEAGAAVDRIAPKDALVIAPYNGDTAFLYQTKRWGWPVVETTIEETVKNGASFFVTVNWNDPDTKYVEENYKIVAKTEKYLIADLTQKKK